MCGFDLCWTQLMSSIKFVELVRTMQRGVHLNKYRLDLMHNGWDIAAEFYCKHKKVWRLYIWSHRTQYKGPSVLNVIATSLLLDCCDYLDWSQINTEKTYHNRTSQSSLKRVMVVKSSFSQFLLVSSFPTHSLHSCQLCMVYMKGASPLPSSNSIASICLLPPFPHPFAFSQLRSLVVLGSR